MPEVVYDPPRKRGTMTIGATTFHAGVSHTSVSDEVLETCKKHKHFLIDGRPAEYYDPPKADVGGAPDPTKKEPGVPVRGFKSKDAALAFAKEHLPGNTYNRDLNLKHLGEQIMADFDAKKAADAAGGDEAAKLDTEAGKEGAVKI